MQALLVGRQRRRANSAHRLAGSADIYQWQRPATRQAASTSSRATTASHCTISSPTTTSTTTPTAKTTATASDDNHNWNCGFEGETADPLVTQIRQRVSAQRFSARCCCRPGFRCSVTATRWVARNAATTTPTARTTRSTWVDWTKRDESLVDFTRAVIALRRKHIVFRQESFFTGRSLHSDGVADLAWFRSDGEQLTASDWSDLNPRTIAMYLSGKDIRQVGAARRAHGR